MIIKLKIDGYAERECIVCSLAHNGYKVWIEKVTHMARDTYYVLFEYLDSKGDSDG